MKKVIYLFVLCMVLGLAGCGQSQENKESSTESTSVQVENKNVSDIVSNEHLTNNDTANFQMPEEGYYSNDFDEILNITKEDDGTYRIEYSVTHLLYVENAIGTYDSETGILSFSGKDDRGNDIKAEIENKGDHLEVTVTQNTKITTEAKAETISEYIGYHGVMSGAYLGTMNRLHSKNVPQRSVKKM